ncbi:MAG: ATP-binding protein [Planctomycetes bacterium]|nr:ATP-binding protein [Planctomycetota bacterium]
MTEGPHRKMLVVEDEADLRCTLVRAMRMLPATEVFEAEDVRSAAEAVKEHEDLSLAVTDIHLPDGNGLDFIRGLRAEGNRLPFVVMTGYHNSGVVVDAYRLGALRYLAKPFELETLLAAIQETLQWTGMIDGIDGSLSAPAEGWIEITSYARYEVAEQLREFITALASLNLDENDRSDLQLAVEELIQNAIEWGDREDPSKRIHVSYALFSDRILIMIKDEGEGFDLDKVPDPTVDPFEHLRQRLASGKRVGGYGIHLTSRVVDDIMYNESGNTVVITKYVKGRQ